MKGKEGSDTDWKSWNLPFLLLAKKEKNRRKFTEFCNEIIACHFAETWYPDSRRRMEWIMTPCSIWAQN